MSTRDHHVLKHNFPISRSVCEDYEEYQKLKTQGNYLLRKYTFK